MLLLVGVSRATQLTSFLTVNTNFLIGRVHVVSVKGGARANTHRVHLPTLGLDGQVYVCMCMGRYSV